MLEEFLGIVGVFSLADVLIDKRRKMDVAWFIFGFSDLSFTRFEYSVIHGFIGVFVHAGRISWRRVAAFSIALSTSSAVLAIATVDGSDWTTSPWLDFVKVFLAMILTFLIDFAALNFLKFIFWQRRHHPVIQSLLALVTPLLLISPIFLGLYATSLAAGSPSIVMLTATILWLPSLLLISAVQLLTCVFGITLRGALLLTRMNRYTVLFSQAHEVPFTFLGILAGLGWIGLRILHQT